MRPILANLLIASFPPNSFPNSSTPPLNTPSSSPLLRPTSSPMTPITPLELGDSTTTSNGGHYEKEDFFSHEAGYFFHSHNEELYANSPYYYYTEQYYNNDNRNTAIQPQVTVNINNPSPLSSGVTTPTNTNSLFNPNSTQAVNNCANHQMMLTYSNNYTAPSQISSGMDFDHYYNQQFYDNNNNVNLPYDTLKNAYHHHNHIQNQDDAQLHEMITGLSEMDIVDSL